jgi:hypothetical protein
MFLVFTSSQPFLQDFPKDSMGIAEQRHVDWPGAVEGRLPKRSPAGSPALSLGTHGDSWGFMGSGCIMKISLISLTKTKKQKLKKISLEVTHGNEYDMNNLWDL